MLTIFSCPKPFTDPHINIIQTNAVKSWTLLKPRPEIILIGDEEGVSDICEELGLRHILKVERNEFGTPLLDSVFYLAQEAAAFSILCYINADIILLSDFIIALKKACGHLQEQDFLLIGRRWNLEISRPLTFDREWETELRTLVKKEGQLSSPSAIDYFVFTKGMYKNIPPFALGRGRWDNWLVWYAISLKVPVVDLSDVNIVVHQRHDYAHLTARGFKVEVNPEQSYNEKLIGRNWHFYVRNIWDSTYVLDCVGIRRAPGWRRLDSWLERLMGFVCVKLKEFNPYSYPAFVFGKRLYRIISRVRNVIHNL